MAYETQWPQYSALFTSDGASTGIITVASTIGLHTKQTIVVSSSTQPALNLEVKEVLTSTTFRVGPIGANANGTDVSAYLVGDTGAVFASIQEKKDGGSNSVIKDVYEAAPTVALRVMQVDPLGNYASPENVTVTVSNASFTILNPSLTVSHATSTASFQVGTIAAAAVSTTSSATSITVMTLSSSAKILLVFNSLNQPVSLCSGTTEILRIGTQSPIIEFKDNDLLMITGTVIRIFYTGLTGPTTGELSITAIS